MKKPREVVLVIGPSIAYVPLTRGLFSLIDSWWADTISEFNWNASYDPKLRGYYAVRSGSRQSNGKRARISLHGTICPCPTGMHVDHKNRCSLDNRSCNLRPVTRSINRQNTLPNRKNKYGMKHVYWHHGKFAAQIKRNSKIYNLGSFSTPKEAYFRVKEFLDEYAGIVPPERETGFQEQLKASLEESYVE